MHGTVLWTGFAPSDNPLNMVQLEVDMTEQWLAGQKMNMCWDVDQDRDTLVRPALVFGRSPEPDIWPRPGWPYSYFLQPLCGKFGPFAQQQPIEIRGGLDCGEQICQPRQGNLGIEDVAHGQSEYAVTFSDPLRLLVPFEWLFAILLACEDTWFSRPPFRSFPSAGDGFRIAVSACFALWFTPDPRIEGVPGP